MIDRSVADTGPTRRQFPLFWWALNLEATAEVWAAATPLIGSTITEDTINEIRAAYQGTNRYAALPGACDF